MALKVHRLTNANLYVNGSNFLGRAEELKLPDVKHMMSEHKSLGMVGKMELFSGIDKMEMTIKWNSFYADALKLAANPTVAVELQVRGNLEDWTGGVRTGQSAAVAYVTGAFKNIPGGAFKQHDNVELESQLTVWKFRLEIAGEVIYEVDVMNNQFTVAGEDILAEYRQNTGA